MEWQYPWTLCSEDVKLPEPRILLPLYIPILTFSWLITQPHYPFHRSFKEREVVSLDFFWRPVPDSIPLDPYFQVPDPFVYMYFHTNRSPVTQEQRWGRSLWRYVGGRLVGHTIPLRSKGSTLDGPFKKSQRLLVRTFWCVSKNWPSVLKILHRWRECTIPAAKIQHN